MQSCQYPPQPPLDDYVRCLWTRSYGGASPDQWRDILPDSYIELLFTFGSRVQIDDGGDVRDLPRCCVVGLLDKPLRLRADGPCTSVGARFFAWGCYPLLGAELQRPAAPISALGGGWHCLGERIAHALHHNDADAAVAHLHAFLLARAGRTPPDQTTSQVAARLYHSDGQTKIGALAQGAHLSRRQIERRFNNTVGVSPKALARTIRFQQLRDRLWHDPDTDLAALAHECGYADQAHCAREFKQFSNRTLRQFAAEMKAARALLGTDVAELNDGLDKAHGYATL